VEDNGASFALVQRVNDGTHLLQVPVPDPVKALGQLAQTWRNQFQLPVIAITGSNGKTTTRELIRQMLASNSTVHSTEGNFNTSIGLPLTLLTLTADDDYSVLELGANRAGDIAELCPIARATHGLITNIAPAHLEGFGSVEEVAKTKGALFRSLTEGVSFVNLSDPRIRVMEVPGEKITYGLSPQCDFPADIHEETDGTYTLTIGTQELTTGSRNIAFAMNVIAAVTVTRTFGMEWSQIQDQILQFEPPVGRCQIRQGPGYTVIDDTYNANLESTRAAIDYLQSFHGNGQRIFVFGDMFELGDSSFEQHRLVGEKCNAARLSAVFTIGSESRATEEQIKAIPVHQHFEDKESLLNTLKATIKAGDKILVKGSRGMKMETIVEALVED
jgi:UDP-N-acetylmuramoyl-tripeptide--D-alanyl-D-alanine ligase